MSAAQGKTVPSLKIVGSNPGEGKVFHSGNLHFMLLMVPCQESLYFISCVAVMCGSNWPDGHDKTEPDVRLTFICNRHHAASRCVTLTSRDCVQFISLQPMQLIYFGLLTTVCKSNL